MKHRKSSQRQKPADRRERKKDPRDTPFPLPPTIYADDEMPFTSEELQTELLVDARTTCMMERERWA